MVTPDRHLGDVGIERAGLLGQLADRTVVIQAHHGGETPGIKIRRILLRDQCIGVGRVADHQHAHVALGMRVERFALRPEDGAVGFQQVLALHAGSAWTRTHQQRVVHILEGDVGVIGCHHAVQRGECAVVEFHDHALQGRQGRGDFQQMQDHRLVRTKHVARGNTEQQGITDLAGGTGNSNSDGSFHGNLTGS